MIVGVWIYAVVILFSILGVDAMYVMECISYCFDFPLFRVRATPMEMIHFRRARVLKTRRSTMMPVLVDVLGLYLFIGSFPDMELATISESCVHLNERHVCSDHWVEFAEMQDLILNCFQA